MPRLQARQGEFDAAASVLSRVFTNIVNSPDEPKFRRLKMANPKVGAMLATHGVRTMLKGAGFVEEGGELVLPDGAPADGAADGLRLLQAQAEERAAASSAQRAEQIEQRKAQAEKENDDRKRMRMGIADDAACRKEPGWQAKAAGVKGGKAITSCSDIGIGQGGGG